MKKIKALLQINLLTVISISIMITMWINYHWKDGQQSAACEKLYSLSESNTHVMKTKIDQLEVTIQNNRKNLNNQLSNIDSQMTQVQRNIHYLINNNHNETVSTPESSRQTIQENISADIKAAYSNEYITSTKIEDNNKNLMESIAQNNESNPLDREELMQTMVQDHDSDPEWSVEANQSVYDAFSDNKANSSIQLENVECGATLCLANLYLDGTTEFEDGYSEILDRLPWHGRGFAQVNEESGRIDFYLAREGYELPYLDNEKP